MKYEQLSIEVEQIKLPPKKEIKILNFTQNYNNKFFCHNFLVVVPPVSFYEPGEKYQIKINNQHFKYAEIIDSKKLYFDEIIAYNYNFLDTAMSEKEYYDYLCNQFSKKKWWNAKDSKFYAVWFKKITQLNLF